MSYIKHRADESVEDYLETILLLQKKIAHVRSIDIANEMNFTKAHLLKMEKSEPKVFWNVIPHFRIY